MIVWLLTVAARRKLTESSEVVTPIPAGALVSTEEPSARSATKAVVPARKTPADVCHQALAGIQALAIPRPTSDRRRPVSLVTGGSGSCRSRLARNSSNPGSCSTSAPHVEPCGASLTVSGITFAALRRKPNVPSDPATRQTGSAAPSPWFAQRSPPPRRPAPSASRHAAGGQNLANPESFHQAGSPVTPP